MSGEQHPLHALPQGYRLQEYELVRVLGFGGFGMTYLGFDHNLDKAVAIKEYLPSDIATRTADHSVAPQASAFDGDFEWGLERFLDEARTLARFDHRHIIKVHRFFAAHGTAYIVMEYAEGETLSAHLERKGTLTEAELKGILYPLLDGLAVVHGADFLHRDIKPGNIVIRAEDGSPVLLDFGAARQAIGAKSRSVTSIVTPGYAPIEQYSSRGRQGPWTDIYALGGVCYRALTGQVPEDATDRMRDDPLVAVAERCAGQASRGFLSAIDQALSVDEGARPQRVEAWRALLEGEGVVQEPEREVEKAEVDAAPIEQRSERGSPPAGRPKKLPFKWLAVALGIVALLIGGKIYVDHAEQLEKQRREQAALEKQRQEEQAALEKKRREQAALEKKRQEERIFVAEVGRMPHPKGMNKGKTDLHITAELNLPVLTISLLQGGADAHAKDKNEWTPLHYAAGNNASETAEVLLQEGADAHAKDKNEWTPLHAAAWNNASAVVEVLLQEGADAHAKDKNGWTPLHYAAGNNASETAEVLLQEGADAHAKDNDGWTPLHAAARKDASAVARVLLQGGADAHAKDNDGNTPLHHAVRKNASETAEVLRRYGGR